MASQQSEANLPHLLKQSLLLLVPPTGVHNDKVFPLGAEFVHALLSYPRWISFLIAAVKRYLRFGRILFELVKGTYREKLVSAMSVQVRASYICEVTF